MGLSEVCFWLVKIQEANYHIMPVFKYHITDYFTMPIIVLYSIFELCEGVMISMTIEFYPKIERFRPFCFK